MGASATITTKPKPMNIDELHCIAYTNFIKQQCRSIRLFTKLNEISWLSIITLLDKLLRFTIPKIRLWFGLIGISFDENLAIYFPNRNHIQIMWKSKLLTSNKSQNWFWLSKFIQFSNYFWCPKRFLNK